MQSYFIIIYLFLKIYQITMNTDQSLKPRSVDLSGNNLGAKINVEDYLREIDDRLNKKISLGISQGMSNLMQVLV